MLARGQLCWYRLQRQEKAGVPTRTETGEAATQGLQGPIQQTLPLQLAFLAKQQQSVAPTVLSRHVLVVSGQTELGGAIGFEQSRNLSQQGRVRAQCVQDRDPVTTPDDAQQIGGSLGAFDQAFGHHLADAVPVHGPAFQSPIGPFLEPGGLAVLEQFQQQVVESGSASKLLDFAETPRGHHSQRGGLSQSPPGDPAHILPIVGPAVPVDGPGRQAASLLLRHPLEKGHGLGPTLTQNPV